MPEGSWKMLKKTLFGLFSPDRLIAEKRRKGPLPAARNAMNQVRSMALPAMAEMALTSLMGVVDTQMAGRALGPEALAALGLTVQPRLLLLSPFLALNVGVTALTARYQGENRLDKAGALLRWAALAAGGLSLLLGGAAFLFADALLRLAGGTRAESGQVFSDAFLYFRLTVCALPAQALSLCLCAALRGLGKTRSTLKINGISNLINVYLNYGLIGGRLGFPRLGIKGAAIATVAGLCAGLGLALIAAGGFKPGKAGPIQKTERKAILCSLSKLSGGALLEQWGVRLGFFLYSRLLFSLGTAAYAANQICMQVMNLTFTVGDGLGIAATALVSRSIGEKRADLALLYGKLCQNSAAVLSLLIGALLALLRRPLALWFIGGGPEAGEVAALTAQTLLALAAVQWFHTGSAALAGALRGAGHTLYTALCNTFCASLVRPVLTLTALRLFRLGLPGTWLMGMAEIGLRYCLFRSFLAYKAKTIQ